MAGASTPMRGTQCARQAMQPGTAGAQIPIENIVQNVTRLPPLSGMLSMPMSRWGLGQLVGCG